jgi:hypothetical protein
MKFIQDKICAKVGALLSSNWKRLNDLDGMEFSRTFVSCFTLISVRMSAKEASRVIFQKSYHSPLVVINFICLSLMVISQCQKKSTPQQQYQKDELDLQLLALVTCMHIKLIEK